MSTIEEYICHEDIVGNATEGEVFGGYREAEKISQLSLRERNGLGDGPQKLGLSGSIEG